MKITNKLLAFIVLNAFFLFNFYAQVGIGTTTPDTSAALDITSTDKGLLIPRINLSDVTTTSLDGTNTAATGLLIWNTNASVTGGNGTGLYYFDGSQWQKLKTPANTLDGAYDQGGSGAGRTITADAGAVEISGTDGILVTGTFGSGLDAVHNTDPQMFFNPKKAAFRAGQVDATQWDNSNIGNYSFATGYNTTASGAYAFAANYATEATGDNSAAFGDQTKSTGNAAFATGSETEAQGANAFTYGKSSIAGGDNSFAGGSSAEAPSVGEVAIGNFPTTYTRFAADASTFNSLDRAFVVGIGNSITNRKNALEVWKDGSVKINNNYTLPKNDGNASGKVMKITANGVQWRNLGPTEDKRTTFTMYADGEYPINTNSDTAFEGFNLAIFPNMFDKNADGVVKIKAVIEYSYLSGTHN